MTPLNKTEKLVLKILQDAYRDWEFCYLGFNAICTNGKLNRLQVKRACRSLKKKGLSQFKAGLFHDDGTVADAGYAITAVGARELLIHTYKA